MNDLISRLRALSRHEHDDLTIGDEAADEIERLRLIVPEVLERLNDDLCAENARLIGINNGLVAKSNAYIVDNARLAEEAARYRKILKAYLRHVDECEGTSFLSNNRQECITGLTVDEMALLHEVNDETNQEWQKEFDRKYPR